MIEHLVSDWIELDSPADGHYVAVADVHGRADLFCAMLAELDRTLPADATLVLLGDLIDRGSQNLKCIDMAIAGIGGRRTLAICGNHESMLVHAMDMDDEELASRALYMWYHNGGEKVMDELECRTDAFSIRRALGPERVKFLETMLPHHMAGGVLFSHAGIDPFKSIDEQLAQPVRDFENFFNSGGNNRLSMRWIRDGWVGHSEALENDMLVVYGHTIQRKGSPLLTQCQVGIDLGAIGLGVLCAIEVNLGKVRFHYVGRNLNPALSDPTSYVLSPEMLESYLMNDMELASAE